MWKQQQQQQNPMVRETKRRFPFNSYWITSLIEMFATWAPVRKQTKFPIKILKSITLSIHCVLYIWPMEFIRFAMENFIIDAWILELRSDAYFATCVSIHYFFYLKEKQHTIIVWPWNCAFSIVVSSLIEYHSKSYIFYL